YVKFYTDVVGLDPKHVGWVYLAFNIWHFLNDPVFGFLLDKMRYRPGKGKFLLVMRRTIPFMLLGLVLMAWTSPEWPQAVILTVFLIELFLFDVAATFYLIAATSYVYLAAPTREDRIDVGGEHLLGRRDRRRHPAARGRGDHRAHADRHDPHGGGRPQRAAVPHPRGCPQGSPGALRARRCGGSGR